MRWRHGTEKLNSGCWKCCWFFFIRLALMLNIRSQREKKSFFCRSFFPLLYLCRVTRELIFRWFGCCCSFFVVNFSWIPIRYLHQNAKTLVTEKSTSGKINQQHFTHLHFVGVREKRRLWKNWTKKMEKEQLTSSS